MSTKGSKLSRRSKHKIEDLVGMRFGNRVIIGRGDNVQGNFGVIVKCDCGSVSTVGLSHLLKGRYKSCTDCARLNQTGSKHRSWKGGRHISMTVYNAWRSSAIRRGIPWNISINDLDELIENQNFKCTFTGDDLTIGHGNGNGLVVNGTASLDRIDSNIGYSNGNIQFVIKSVNMAKQDMDEQDFIKLCRKITKYRGVSNG